MLAGALLLVGGASAIGMGYASQVEPPRPVISAGEASEPAPAEEPGVYADDQRPEVVPPAAPAPVLPRSEPVALDIPAIDVHSALSTVGLNPDGTLEVPAPGPLYDLAAWYRNSPTPGELGPSVIEGHLDSHKGPSVFFRLGELTIGDEVNVRRADGSTATFRVTAVQLYEKAAFPTEEVYGDIDHAGLRLLTCGGPIDPQTKHYTDNLVVYAALV